MSGHSKWKNIKRQKEAADLVRGNVFSKLSRLITIAVVEGGGVTDPEHNVKLRLAIDKARVGNMPKENINRAIEKGAGPGVEALKEINLEAFIHSGVALLIIATTDNVNRTLSEVRSVLDRAGAKLGSQGSVAHFFKKCGLVKFKKSLENENEVLVTAEKLGAFDIDQDENYFYVYIPFEDLSKIKEIDKRKYESAQIYFKPLNFIQVSEGESKKIISLIEALEAHDDIQKVYANFSVQGN